MLLVWRTAVEDEPLVVWRAEVEPALLADVEAALLVCLAVEDVPLVVWRETLVAVVEPVPSPVRRTVWPVLDEDAADVVLLAEVLVDLELVLAAGVVTLEADEELVVAEELVCRETVEDEVDAVVVCREGVVAADVVVVEEVVVREAEEVVCFCAEASNPKATRDRAAAAVATISIILFIA